MIHVFVKTTRKWSWLKFRFVDGYTYEVTRVRDNKKTLLKSFDDYLEAMDYELRMRNVEDYYDSVTPTSFRSGSCQSSN